MNPYVVFLLYLLAILGFVFVTLVMNRYLGPKPVASALKMEPFECGATPVDTRNTKAVPIKYYGVAIAFMLFDLETVFLFIWALGAQPLTGFMLFTFFIFAFLLGADPAVRVPGETAGSGDGIAMAKATIPIRASACAIARVRVFLDQEGRVRRLGAQVLAVSLPVRHRLLRDGVHGGKLHALRYRPLRRRAAALFATAVGLADGRRHAHAQAGAGPPEGLRADVRAQVGDGVRRLRDQRRVLPELCRRRGHRQDHPGRHLRSRMPTPAGDRHRRDHEAAGPDRGIAASDHHRRPSDHDRGDPRAHAAQLVPAGGEAEPVPRHARGRRSPRRSVRHRAVVSSRSSRSICSWTSRRSTGRSGRRASTSSITSTPRRT